MSDLNNELLKELNTININNSDDYSAQKGGAIWNNNADNNALLAIKAANESNYPVVDFMVNNNMISNYGTQDVNGNTLLHHLVGGAKDSLCNSIIHKIINKKNADSFINIQDGGGNTPLIKAVQNNQMNLCDVLVGSGAKLDIKNNAGYQVAFSETDASVANTNNNLVGGGIINDLIAKFISVLPSASQPSETIAGSLPDTLGVTESDRMIANVGTPQLVIGQEGGRIAGTRKLHMYSESSTVPTSRSQSRIERLLKSQKDEVHERVLKKIIELLKVDDLTAKAYKSLLYAKIKDANPNLSGYDRAIEMEKLTTKKDLEKFSDKAIKERKELLKSKMDEKTSDKKTTTEISSEKPMKKQKVAKVKKEETESSLSSHSSFY